MAEVKQSPVKILITDGALIPDRGNRVLRTSWKISLYGALILLLVLPLFGMSQVQVFLVGELARMFPTPDLQQLLADVSAPVYVNQYWGVLPQLPEGILMTFEVTVCSILLAAVFGFVAGLGQISRRRWINQLSMVYVEVVRGIPLLVQIFYIYFALGKILHLDNFPAAVIAMAFCYGAYLGEIFRAGIQAVPKGQMEAALALGLSRSQAIWTVVVPQTVKIILPAIGNEFIALLKDSSLVSVMALTDLLRAAKNYGSAHGDYFPALTMAALIYLVMTLILSWLVALMEERLNRHAR